MGAINWSQFKILGIGCIALVLGFGCEGNDRTFSKPEIQASEKEREKPQNTQTKVKTLNEKFILFEVNPASEPIHIYNVKNTGVHSFSSVDSIALSQGFELKFATNGGIFNSDLKAKGLLISEGIQTSPLDTLQSGYGNFYLQPNGVFCIDTNNNARIMTTQEFMSEMTDSLFTQATQSGPVLLINGKINPEFNPDSKNVFIRNAVATTRSGLVLFAISTEKVSFYEMASFLKGKGCKEALYLDGAISKFYVPSLQIGSLDEGSNLGPIIAVFKDTLYQ